MLAYLVPLADAAAEGRKVIIAMLIVGLIFLGVVVLGDLSEWLLHRRRRS